MRKHKHLPAKVLPLRGSLAEVLVSSQEGGDASAAFCLEPLSNASTGGEYCPSWARSRSSSSPTAPYNSRAGKWLTVDITSATASSVTIDLAPLHGKKPAGVRYSWGIFDCCDAGDPMLYRLRISRHMLVSATSYRVCD